MVNNKVNDNVNTDVNTDINTRVNTGINIGVNTGVNTGSNNTRLAILGKCNTRDKCPYNDTTLDIWQINHHSTKPKRVDKVVDIHANGHDGDINYSNFPFEEVKKIVNQPLNNTLSYLLVYAYILGYKEVYLYGCKFDGWEEIRKQQRLNVQCTAFLLQNLGMNIQSPYDNLIISNFRWYIM